MIGKIMKSISQKILINAKPQEVLEIIIGNRLVNIFVNRIGGLDGS